MKKPIIIILLFFTGICLKAQEGTIKGNIYFLTGKIINDINSTPHCGVVAWGTVIEFEIIEYSDSAYTCKNIGVIFTCPEFFGTSFFEVGKTYEVKLADENQADFSWSVPNEKILQNYPLKSKLYVLEAHKIE